MDWFDKLEQLCFALIYLFLSCLAVLGIYAILRIALVEIAKLSF